MICHELERSAKAYLIAVSGQLSTEDGGLITDASGFGFASGPTGLMGYVTDGLSVQIDSNGIPVSAGQVFRFYLGESGGKIERPCAIIFAQTGDVESDTGNETVQLTVSIEGTASSYTGESDTLLTLQEVTEALVNALKRDDVADYLNLYRTEPERMTVIGVTDRQNIKAIAEDHVVHQIVMTCYCAAMNLDPALPVQS